jgi:hypothetical protein
MNFRIYVISITYVLMHVCRLECFSIICLFLLCTMLFCCVVNIYSAGVVTRDRRIGSRSGYLGILSFPSSNFVFGASSIRTSHFRTRGSVPSYVALSFAIKLATSRISAMEPSGRIHLIRDWSFEESASSTVDSRKLTIFKPKNFAEFANLQVLLVRNVANDN